MFSSYKPVRTYATVLRDRIEVVDFRLTRLHSDPNGQSNAGPQPTENPSEKEFKSFIKDLSLGPGLELLVRKTATDTKFHYRRYKELSAFLRGLTLNFPSITSLRRWEGLVCSPKNVQHKPCWRQGCPGCLCIISVFCHQFGPECRVSNSLGTGNLQQTRSTWSVET